MEQQRYQVIIAEDNIHQMSLLQKYANEMDLLIASTVSSGVRLIEEVKLHKPDIVLLDIGLKKLDGISAMKQIHAAGLYPQMIFVTGSISPEHLLAGFEFGSVDYITKPINESRFKNAIHKAKEKIYSKKLLDAETDIQENHNFIVITVNYRDVTIAENQIIYVDKDKLQRNRYNVYLKDGNTIETTTQLKELKEMCPNLVYSHRSYLVNVNYITAIQPDGLINKSYNISLAHTEDIIPLTRKNYIEVNEIFSKLRQKG